MRAMILAAGRGERMGPLTAQTPKPLLKVGENYLIEYALLHLKRAHIHEIVINVSYQAQQIKTALGNGGRYGVDIIYSDEPERLETGGGILQALPLLGDAPFVLLSSDVLTDFPLLTLPKEPSGLAHLVLVNNPPYHPKGDFGLQEGYLNLHTQPTFTFGNVSVLRKELFAAAKPGHFRLNQLLKPAVLNQQITGEYYPGIWYNVGTANDLQDATKHAHLIQTN